MYSASVLRSPILRSRSLATVIAVLAMMSGPPAAANDGPFLSVPAGGIVFQKTDAVSMDKEDLFISENLVRVSYVFKNRTAEDFTTMVAFPLPVYRLYEFEDAEPNFAEFTVRVDGSDVKYNTVVQGVLVKNADTEFAAPSRAQFEPHRDVTDLLEKHGVEIRDLEKSWETANQLSADAKADLIKEGVLREDGDNVIPQWFVKVTYTWEQTFPAGAEIRVEHEYRPQTGYFNEWHLEPFVTEVYEGKRELDAVPALGTTEFNAKCAGFLKRYDIDDTALQWAARQKSAKKRFAFSVVDYILTTATYWSGPIKDFTLTIEKSKDSECIVSVDFDGMKKIGDRRFQAARKNFTPDRDLSVLFIHAYDEF